MSPQIDKNAPISEQRVFRDAGKAEIEDKAGVLEKRAAVSSPVRKVARDGGFSDRGISRGTRSEAQAGCSTRPSG